MKTDLEQAQIVTLQERINVIISELYTLDYKRRHDVLYGRDNMAEVRRLMVELRLMSRELRQLSDN